MWLLRARYKEERIWSPKKSKESKVVSLELSLHGAAMRCACFFPNTGRLGQDDWRTSAFRFFSWSVYFLSEPRSRTANAKGAKETECTECIFDSDPFEFGLPHKLHSALRKTLSCLHRILHKTNCALQFGWQESTIVDVQGMQSNWIAMQQQDCKANKLINYPKSCICKT